MQNTSQAKKKILLDASVLIAGLLSPTGGSAKILASCREQIVLGVLSNAVAEEVVKNLPKDRNDLHQQFSEIKNRLTSVEITDEEMGRFVGVVHEKDVHVVTAASKADADFLVSLNRKHLLENKTAKQTLPFQIVSPKELIGILGL